MESNITKEKTVVVPKGPITLLMTKNGPIMIVTNNTTLPSQKVLNETKQTLGLENSKSHAVVGQSVHNTEVNKRKNNVNNVEPKEYVNILTASATERNKSARAKMLIDGLQSVENTEIDKSNHIAKGSGIQWIKKPTESTTVPSKSNILTAAQSERSKSIKAKRLIDSLQDESTENSKVNELKRDSSIHWVKRGSMQFKRPNFTQKQSENTKDDLYSETSTSQLELENENYLYSCQKCGEKFEKIDVMMKHFLTHRNEKSSTPPAKKLKSTPKEGKKVANLDNKETENMGIHIKSHEDVIDKPFSCDTCGKRFISNMDLMQHVKQHAGDKIFSCPTCEKKFTQKHSLLSHLLSHVGEKPFSCSICEKSFHLESTMRRHEKHHLEGEDSCHICAKTFANLQSKKMHMRTIHKKNEDQCDEKYICGVCDMSYQSKSDLLKHLSEHTENDEPIELFEESFLCPYCEDVFNHKDDLIKHFEAVHT